jgi:hypothetical protein
MQAEMNKLFAEGGVMQEGGTVDPVSGNDVPPGAMQEEVRDDIDAKLSEGEFVIPADVVRYIGLETLMKLRDKAKMGLQKMEEIGQMGNAAEVPDGEALHSEDNGMDDDSFSSEIDSIMNEDNGEENGYAAGGYVAPKNPAASSPPVDQRVYDLPDQSAQYSNAPIKGFQMVAMTNASGQTIYIPFINGVPQLNVPDGYKVASTTPTTPAEATPTAPTNTSSDSGGGGGGGGSDGGGSGSGGNTDGSSVGGGQGISNSAISAGLAGMAFGESLAGKAISAVLGIPASTIAGLVGKGVVDNQLDAISASFGAMSDAATLGGQLGTVSDESGNISTVSNQGITDAFDQATFGTTSSQMSADAASNATQAAETGMTTNAEGQTVSSNESIAAQDAANFGTTTSDTTTSDTSVADANGGQGFGGGEYAKGGFVSKRKNTKTGKSTSFVTRQN